MWCFKFPWNILAPRLLCSYPPLRSNGVIEALELSFFPLKYRDTLQNRAAFHLTFLLFQPLAPPLLVPLSHAVNTCGSFDSNTLMLSPMHVNLFSAPQSYDLSPIPKFFKSLPQILLAGSSIPTRACPASFIIFKIGRSEFFTRKVCVDQRSPSLVQGASGSASGPIGAGFCAAAVKMMFFLWLPRF